MAEVIFYEKVGCGNNTKQKAWLQAAGHQVIAKNLLTETWTIEKLMPFLAGLSVAEWFNRAAPRIKSGDVVPETLSAEQALSLLITDPLFIRRPLIQVGNAYRMGFDAEIISTWLTVQHLPQNQDLEACPRIQHPCTTSQGSANE